MSMIRFGSMTSITDLPPEIIEVICNGLTLEEIANLQEAYPSLDTAIDFVFFPKFKKMRVDIDENGPMITISPRSTHSYIHEAFSIDGNSPQIQSIIRSCTSVDSLTISCSDHTTDYSILHAINRSDITLTKLVINFHTPEKEECKQKEVCRKIVNRSHRKITAFVHEQAATLATLKVTTSKEDKITIDLKAADGASTSTETHVRFAHVSDSSLNQSLIYPIFNALNHGKPCGPSSVHLTVDWRSRLDLALQSAFMVALPMGHRGGVKRMQIGFSSKVSSLSHDEIHSCLEAFSTQLSETFRLQELICDFKNSAVDPCQLERTISVLSSQLGKVHRIRVLTDAPLVEEPNLIKQEWAKLPPVY